MTVQPKMPDKSLEITCKVRKTEMGVEVTLHSLACNITVELDLDYDAEYFHAMSGHLVQMVNDQLELFAKQEEEA